jgi:protein tyrosine/serine phosphatase
MKTKIIFPLFFGVITLAASGFAQTSPSKTFNGQKTGISNFGQMDERFFRGERPSKKDLVVLKSIGIDTIIDLTDNTPGEQAMVEAAGMRYVNIPVKDRKIPTDAAIAKFLEVLKDPATGKFYLHCAGGRHRTGDMGAVYRSQEGWTYEKAMQEMENYDFYTSNGHQAQKDFVIEYFKKAAERRVDVIGVKVAAPKS